MLADARAKRRRREGGLQITVKGYPIKIQPGKITYETAEWMEKAHGRHVWGTLNEIMAGRASPMALAFALWVGLYIEDPNDPVDIDEVMALVLDLDSSQDIEIEMLGHDGEPITMDELESMKRQAEMERTAAAAEAGGLDIHDPLRFGPGSEGSDSGPHSQPASDTDPTTSSLSLPQS